MDGYLDWLMVLWQCADIKISIGSTPHTRHTTCGRTRPVNPCPMCEGKGMYMTMLMMVDRAM
jgi:hypothetical protein